MLYVKDDPLVIVNKITIGFVVFAIVVFVYGSVSYERFDWVAISKPVSMETGKDYQLSFVSQKNGYYILELDTERSLDKREQNCRLGIENYKTEECIKCPEILTIYWAIQQDGKIITEGKSTDSKSAVWGENIIKVLDSFNTIHGKEYSVNVTIKQVDKALIAANPAIRVSINSVAHKNAYVKRDLAYLVSYVLFGFALLMWFISFVYSRIVLRKNKRLWRQ